MKVPVGASMRARPCVVAPMAANGLFLHASRITMLV